MQHEIPFHSAFPSFFYAHLLSLHCKPTNAVFKLLICSMAVHYQRALKPQCENTQYGFCIHYCSLISQINIKFTFSGCSYKFFYIIWICKTNFYFLHSLLLLFVLSLFFPYFPSSNKSRTKTRFLFLKQWSRIIAVSTIRQNHYNGLAFIFFFFSSFYGCIERCP